MNYVLSATSLARNGYREKKERRSVLAVEKLDLGGVFVTSLHVRVSTVRQSSSGDLSKLIVIPLCRRHDADSTLNKSDQLLVSRKGSYYNPLWRLPR